MKLSLIAIATFVVFSPSVFAQEIERRATWSVPLAADVKAHVDDYATAKKADETTRLKIAAIWPDEAAPASGADLLERVGTSLSVLDPKAKVVVDFCQNPRTTVDLPKFEILTDESAPVFVRSNLKLLYGRWLGQNELMDESLEQLKGMNPADVVDPASLLFHQALAHHNLLEKEPCLSAVAKLMENEEALPRRYSQLARLMEADLKPLKPDSLDEIARLMSDVGRRLDLARAGKKVRDEEETIVAKLEKLIEEKEKQQQQQQQQQQSQAQGNQSSNPAQDSTPAGGPRGKGEVDPKNIGKKDGWGNLPPKERQEVLQQIGRELPAHFRETIEEYFKRLAQDGVK
ncbi:MAG: hypothetical protein ACKVP0_01465 [Pirellulaceae bacterium]